VRLSNPDELDDMMNADEYLLAKEDD
jgi:hypothetical protein